MIKINKRLQDSITSLYLRHKYLSIGSALVFLLAIPVYLIFSPGTYKVTTRFAVKTGQDPENVIKDLKSTALLQQVIHQLPVQVAYYEEKSTGNTEISNDSLPIRFVFLNSHAVSSPVDLKIFVIDNHQYKILKDRTFTYFDFDEPVKLYSFAQFKIIKGPAFKITDEPINIRVYSDDNLLEEYGENLDAEFIGEDHKMIELSFTGKSAKKGRDFLNKLVDIYHKSGNISSVPNVPANSDRETIHHVKYEVAILKLKIAKFEDQQTLLMNSGGSAAKADSKESGSNGTSTKQKLAAIKDSISKFNILLRSKQLEYSTLSKK